MPRTKRLRTGVALLEAILALLLFGIVVTSFLQLSRQVTVANAHTTRAETEIAEANRLMESASLWPTEDLVRRLGSRDQGQFQLNIERVSPSLYALIISNSSNKMLLSTVVYRPDRSVNQ